MGRVILAGQEANGVQTEARVDASGNLLVKSTVGTAATDLGKAEDAAHSSGATGVMVLAVRKDTATALAGTDGDYIPLIVDASGRVHIAPLPAGTAAIGKLAANSGVDIGDVDVTSLPALAAGTNLIGKVSIDQVTANANEVVIKSITAGDTNIGNVDIASAIPAGDNNIGNVDLASAIPAGTNIIGAVKQDVPNWTEVKKTGDYTTQQTAATLWQPAGGKSFVITDIIISTATAGTITLLDDSTIIREYKFGANGGVVENMVTHEKGSAADKILKITTSGALDCFVVVKGYEV